MKVLFVYPYFTFPDLVLDTLPSYLAKSGYEVDVATYLRKPDEKKAYVCLKQKRIQFYFVDALCISIPNLVTAFPFFLSLETMIKKLQPDIIHVNNLTFLTTFQSMRLARKLRKKGVVHVHGVIAERGVVLDLAQRAYIRTIGHAIFRDATKMICLTGQDAREIYRYGCPAGKIRIIPNGVDIDKFRPRGDGMDSLIMWSGRFVPEKGLEYLIKALNIVTKKHPTINLAMAGDGPLLPKIHSMAKQHGLARNVIFKGRLNRAKFPDTLNKASICVFPSLSEGMPLALLEAMACGKAVIGSDIPGINDVITCGENGILVPPRDSEALAKAISTLLNDKNFRRKLGRNARQLMLEKYSWDIVINKIEKVYHEAIEEEINHEEEQSECNLTYITKA